jgi:hypothetical protein
VLLTVEVILGSSAPNERLETLAVERALRKMRGIGVCIGARLDSIDMASGWRARLLRLPSCQRRRGTPPSLWLPPHMCLLDRLAEEIFTAPCTFSRKRNSSDVGNWDSLCVLRRMS